MSAKKVIERLVEALNAHDLDSLVASFEESYRSEQPAHPERGFGGREQVRINWSTLFAEIPDIQAELLRTAVEADTCWAELRIHGNRADGSTLELRGVIIHGVSNDRVAWARLYLVEVEQHSGGIDQSVRRMASGHDGSLPPDEGLM